jgi:hypothetical protein
MLFVAAGFLAGVLAETRPALATADNAKVDQPAAQADSFSTGKSGSRLKWIAQRPEPVKEAKPAKAVKETKEVREKVEAEITPTQYLEPTPACEPSCDGVRAAQDLQPSTKSWSGSVGNRKPAPAEKLDDELSPAANGKKTLGPKSNQLEKELGSRQYSLNESCPSPKDLKRISELTTNITPSEGDLPRDCPLGNDVFHPRSFAPITYTWVASALCHKPLYFEDEQLERYGHMAGPWVQPFASCANFFCTVPLLPYKMGLEPPNECIYTLGYYRPGSCAPYLFDPLPLSVRAAFFEAGAWVGGAMAF